MRRILRKIAEGKIEELGDTSTLTDPSVVINWLERNCDQKKFILLNASWTCIVEEGRDFRSRSPCLRK
jgi:hypothetical protein